MNASRDPYQPPLAEVNDPQPERIVVRPKSILVLVLLYLSLYPIFIWRVSLGGKLQLPALILVFLIVGIYTACVAHGLYSGKRWARALVLGFAFIWVCMLVLALIGASWELRTQIFIVEALLKATVGVILLLPTARIWFSSRRL
ncbi:MAG: hypothetical protein ABI858_04915 [Pseudoxanthomonas sp.]